jgi:glycosyltransferase involved in cell wall biosynthesis
VKILLAQHLAGIGGSENYLLSLCPALRAAGVDAHFALLCDDPSAEVVRTYASRMEATGVPIRVFRIGPRIRPAAYQELAQYISSTGFDLVHSHLFVTDLIFAFLRRFFGCRVPLVSTKHGYKESYLQEHGMNPAYQPLNMYRLTAAWVERHFLRSFAVCRALCDLYIALKVTRPDAIEYIYHGFDYPPTPAPEPGFRRAPQQAVIVGRLVAFKGHMRAFEAMKHLRSTHPMLKLVVVGSGPLEEELHHWVQQEGMEDTIVFAGFHPEPARYMAASDIVLVPSVAEAFGLVLLEAMNARKPVVCFDVPAPNEVMLDGETGLLARPFDATDFAQKVALLLDDPALSARMGDAGYARREAFFNLDRMTGETVQFYERALAEVPSARGAGR